MLRWSGILAVIAIGVACALAGCGGGSTTTIVKTTTTTASTATGSPIGFTDIPTVKCRTIEGVHQPAARLEPTTAVAAPSSLAEKLAAYRDAAGTMVIAPIGFECAAGIGVDGSENVTAYPKGAVDPAKDPSKPRSGTVVSLDIATACQGCIAEAVCTLFPEAGPVKDYYGTIGGVKCPEKPLREEVSYPAPSTALFSDPPKVAGTGLGSGGADPSLGAISYSEPIGVRKLSCTLPPEEAELCTAIVGATFTGAPLG